MRIGERRGGGGTTEVSQSVVKKVGLCYLLTRLLCAYYFEMKVVIYTLNYFIGRYLWHNSEVGFIHGLHTCILIWARHSPLNPHPTPTHTNNIYTSPEVMEGYKKPSLSPNHRRCNQMSPLLQTNMPLVYLILRIHDSRSSIGLRNSEVAISGLVINAT